VDRSTAASGMAEAYSALAARLRAEGLMNHRYGFFWARCAAVLLAVAAGWVGLFAVGDRWVAVVIGAGLGLLSTQVVFFGHDAGHHQLFKGARANRVVGLVAGNLLTGLSFGWWEPKHGAHHAHPNQIDRDPDIAPGAVAFTAKAAGGRRGFGRVALRRQAWTFFPLLALEGIGLRISSVRSVWRRRAPLEGALMLLNLAVYLTVVLSVLSPLKALVFVVVQQAAFGLYMGSCFAPNHTGMPAVPADVRTSFAERQVVTARNVNGGRLVTFLLGGLNYQIEHHLFPRMPMINLSRSQPYVQAFCRTHGLPYRQDSLFGSYRAAITHLARIGAGGADPRFPTGRRRVDTSPAAAVG
jgi:fatty acid desaturase